jgi:signal recognition particle subunit SRP54
MSDFTLDDFKVQIQRVLYPGILERTARLMMPREMREILADEKQQSDARRSIGIIESMTQVERLDPPLIDSSRARRLARGAGVSPDEVLALLMQYARMTPVLCALMAKHKARSMTSPVTQWWSRLFGNGDSL